MRVDSKFLSNHNLMDYSLLLVIELVKIEDKNGNKTNFFTKDQVSSLN